MNKKKLSKMLLIIGAVLLCASVVLAIVATENKKIIGGADLPTFLFVFYYEKRGLYSALAFLGVVSIVISIIMGIAQKKR